MNDDTVDRICKAVVGQDRYRLGLWRHSTTYRSGLEQLAYGLVLAERSLQQDAEEDARAHEALLHAIASGPWLLGPLDLGGASDA